MRHVNTGCRYDENGQEITIVERDGATHFIDHSRYVDGTIAGTGLTNMQVVKAYVHGRYSRCELCPLDVQGIRKHRLDYNFKDISDQYRFWIRFG